MSNSFFELEHSASLQALAPGAKIHIIGICGVAMGALALALEAKGFAVSGSDKEFYPPMSEMLDASGITIFRSYEASHIDASLDLVVIGNSAPRTNPEVVAVGELKIPHTFFAKVAGELLLDERTGIVMSGTHGKTTTTALMSYGLRQLNLAPAYFIGGKVPQLPTTLEVGNGPHGIIEGDEYDSVFYVKRPKFLFYKSDLLVVNALEFDHADIYEDLAAIEREFDLLLQRVPKDGVIIACVDFPAVQELIVRYSTSADTSARIITFGEAESADYQIVNLEASRYGQTVSVVGPEEPFSFTISLRGAMNARNALATTIVAKELNIAVSEWEKAIKDFVGASRRLEVRHEDERITVLEDFAHHPTAVKEAIRAVKASYPDAEHWVAFEPRSNTSRRNIFQKEYGESFAGIARLFIREIATRSSDADQALLDVNQLLARIAEDQVQGEVLSTGEDIANKAIEYLSDDQERAVVITIMSNGSFDGLPSLLAEKCADL